MQFSVVALLLGVAAAAPAVESAELSTGNGHDPAIVAIQKGDSSDGKLVNVDILLPYNKKPKYVKSCLQLGLLRDKLTRLRAPPLFHEIGLLNSG